MLVGLGGDDDTPGRVKWTLGSPCPTLTPPVLWVSPGYVTGGHVMRLFHGHMDECLTTSAPEQGEERRWGAQALGFPPP